mmetsp:Transcript_17609/g.21682  ORF Transcript_17609/g.21682 Transcript_17609/m.21682 type:complete len:346 (+) Transcript_17609:127-1164(+)|eukprot:CAMPEP_0204892622 /NCGR_PEP_ID=MMETSP1349-20130617/29622_1 /ASSEMBLY_ACC=CAM_ASM_000710 /TAXON_ID=215587 /ORGANISM="Aplanochytrium stocchinoi, Strain GSBS06" /LENGTH=345 /DNA_ID=CAMNT_0052058673 /DNA_START=105 /DNA_END=1142 /DNA_ORIENTATION=-
MNATNDDDGDGFDEDFFYTVLFDVILLFFVAGMTATCSIDNLYSKFKNKGILVGLGCQFFLNPLIGLLVINIVSLRPAEEIVLLVMMSSPGGTYSNLLCSFFNADLALSVAMSAVSTLAAAFMLPFNMYVYVEVLSGSDVRLDWVGLGATIACVEVGVLLGVILGKRYPGKKYQHRFNIFGNISGIALFIIAMLLSQTEESLFEKAAVFWGGCIIPAMVAATVSISIASLLRLAKPERLSIGVETVYQNTSIPTAVAFATFGGAEAKQAISIPVAYGLIQALTSVSILVIGWKNGWAFAPANEPFCKAISDTYQPYAEVVTEKAITLNEEAITTDITEDTVVESL